MIDKITIQRILDTAQIVEVVQDFVTLRKRGANYWGICPFHDDKSPSMSVSPSKGIFKCFACGEGGNAVHFVMKHENMSYPDALRYLAKKYGIEIAERELTDEEKKIQNERDSLYVVSEYACSFFKDQLHHTEEGTNIGMAYFHNRHFRDDIIEKFQLGYSPENRETLATTALSKGYQKEFLVKTGLCIENEHGILRDRFHGRVIFPIHNVSGRVVGFGARVLASATKGVNVKYMNSPESTIFDKKCELYGIYLAKQSITKQDRVYLVEGYTDVISMYQAGIENVVASSGTALTQQQIKLVKRFTKNIVVLYDGDSAGIKASVRGVDMLLQEGMNVKICLLPEDEDPDSFARTHDTTELRRYLEENEKDFITFKAGLLKETTSDPVKKAELIRELTQSIAFMPDAITRDVYIQACAEKLGMNVATLVREVARRREEWIEQQRQERERQKQERERQAQNSNTTGSAPEAGTDEPEKVAPETAKPAPVPAATTPFKEAEKQIIRMVVRYGEQLLPDFVGDDGKPLSVTDYVSMALEHDELALQYPLYARILQEAVAHQHDEGFKAAHYFVTHPDPEVSQACADMVGSRYQLSKIFTERQATVSEEDRLEELLPQAINSYKYENVSLRLKEVKRQLQDPLVMADDKKCNEVIQAYTRLQQLQQQLAKELGRVM